MTQTDPARGLKDRPHLPYTPAVSPKKLPREPDPEVTRLLDDLKAWCDQEYGRQSEIARFLGVDRKRINDWLARRTEPSLGMGLRILRFLQTQQAQNPETPDQP